MPTYFFIINKTIHSTTQYTTKETHHTRALQSCSALKRCCDSINLEMIARDRERRRQNRRRAVDYDAQRRLPQRACAVFLCAHIWRHVDLPVRIVGYLLYHSSARQLKMWQPLNRGRTQPRKPRLPAPPDQADVSSRGRGAPRPPYLCHPED